MRFLPVVVLAALTTVSCAKKSSGQEFQKLAEEFVYKTLSFSPVTASGQGLHQYNGANFDLQLDDPGSRAIDKQRDYYIDVHRRMEAFDKDSLAPEDRADYDIIDSSIALALFDLDVVQTWHHAPQSYVELLGSALFNPFVLEYAPKEQRYDSIIARLKKIPDFLGVTRRQLFNVPPVWAQVAKAENDGNIDLVDKTLREGVPPEKKAAYDEAAAAALDTLKSFNRFLEHEVPNRGSADWRLGAEHYATKFR